MIPACEPPVAPRPPKIPLPPSACDTRARVFGPGSGVLEALLRRLGEGRGGVKLSDAYRLKSAWPDGAPGRAFREAPVRTNPDRLVRGTDRLRPRVDAEMPNDGHLLRLFQDPRPDPDIRRRILASNPSALYGAPAGT